MANRNHNFLDINEDFLIYRHGSGITLVKPEVHCKLTNSPHHYYTGHTVKSFLRLEYLAAFADTNSTLQKTSDTHAAWHGCSSAKCLSGKNVYDFLKPSTAERIKHHDNKTLLQNQVNIFEEDVFRKDGSTYSLLLVKSPVYINNQLAGLLGFGFKCDEQPMAGFLKELAQLGLLNQISVPLGNNRTLPGLQLDKIYLSKRETEILQHVATGKSARVIGAILAISQRTVESHMENLKAKL
jgi:DNA-binding CsgD family transcriptional regulator